MNPTILRVLVCGSTPMTQTQMAPTHWAFADIDRTSWKPIVNNSGGQWDDFKNLKNVKRIVSFGGWAASTEPATYNIIRSAIIEHRDIFASNLAQFAKDEGIDGIDIDWEYPGVSTFSVASAAREVSDLHRHPIS
jgi:GH18 family chitinase